MISVLVAEELGIVRGALAALLSFEEDFTVVAEVACDEVVIAARRTRPDVVVLGIDLAGVAGLMVAERLADEVPECRTVVLTTTGSPGNVMRALAGSVQGFLVKDAPADQLAVTVRRVADGDTVVAPELLAVALNQGKNPLSKRETDVLREITTGASMADIAARLGISVGTSRNYASNAITKLQARNRTDAIRIAREMGWI